MKLAVNCTRIDPATNLGVLTFGQRLAKAIRDGMKAEVVGLIPTEFINKPAFADTFARVIPASSRTLDMERFDVELLLHHLQTPCTASPRVMIMHDLHLWDVPWKYGDPARMKKNLHNTVMRIDAVVTEFPRTYYDLPKVMSEVGNRLFLTVSPTMIEYVAPDTHSLLESRTKYGISENEKVILYPAQLQPHKNHINLFQAMKILRGSSLKLVCTGSELQKDHAARLYGFIPELGLEERVVMTGRIDARELQTMYHLADLVVAAPLTEGGAYIAQEAIVYGKSVACSDIRPVRLHLAQMRACIPLFDPLDPRDIAETIRCALDTPQDNSMAKAIIESWTWNRLGEQYYRVLDWLRAGKRAGQMPMFLDDSLGYLNAL